MSFLAAQMLWMLPAGVAAPIIIHLLNRGRPRRIPWAATRFLLESVQKNRNRHKLKDLLLLLARILALLLLVLLAAQPVIWLATQAGTSKAASTSMFIVDLSASMAQSDGRQSRMDLARQAALDALDNLGPGSACGLLGATQKAVPLVPKPSLDLNLVRRSLERLAGTSQGTDLLPAIERGLRELEQAGGSRPKTLMIFTDSQAPAWRGRAAIEELARQHPDISIQTIALGEEGEPNLSIANVTVQPAAPGSGEVARVRVDVGNFGKEAVSDVRVTLAQNQEAPENETTIARIEPGATASARLDAVFRSKGAQTLLAQIPPDRFPSDDKRSLAVEVGSPRKILVVAGPGGGDERRSPGFFVRKALEAASPRGAVEVVTPASLAQGVPEGVTAVFACGVSPLDEAFWTSLEDYVTAGGSAVVFPGADPATSALGISASTRWLPGSLAPAARGSVSWSQDTMNHPITAAWKDPRQVALSAVRATQRNSVQANPGSSALAAWSDGGAVAVSAPVGKGQAALWSVAPVPEATNLVLHPYFPVLLADMVSVFSGEAAQTQLLLPGQTFTRQVPPTLIGTPVFLESDREAGRTPVGEVIASGDGAVVALPPLEKPGGFRVFLGSQEEALTSFAVALDPIESELATAPPLETTASQSDAPETGEPSVAPLRESQDLWRLFAILLAVVLFFEFATATALTVARR